jgi:hypothetical protein
MTFPVLLAAVSPTNGTALPTAAPAEAAGGGFGILFWLLTLLAGVALSVIIERLLYYHRVQIDSAQFLAGVRNVLKRDNVIEAISICDATPGPVSRLVKSAILSRDAGRGSRRGAKAWRTRRRSSRIGWAKL